MKNTICTPRAVLTLLISGTLLFNSTVPAFAQNYKISATALAGAFPQVIPDTSTTDSQQVAFEQRLQKDLTDVVRGSLDMEQLGRVNEIRALFTPPAQGETAPDDFGYFQTLYRKNIEQEFQHQYKQLQSSKGEVEKRIASTAQNYRREVYATLANTLVPKTLAREVRGNTVQQVLKELQQASFNLKEDLGRQIRALAKRHPGNVDEKQLLENIANTVETDSAYTGREQAIEEWKKQAQTNLRKWYTGNLQQLNQWKKSAQDNEKTVFEKEYNPQLLALREEIVKQAVADLWNYKDHSPKALEVLLEVAPIIAPMQTLAGESFFSPQQKTWLVEKYFQVLRSGKDCGNQAASANACNQALISMGGLSMLAGGKEVAWAIHDFMQAKQNTPYSVPSLLLGASALLSMKQYTVLNSFLARSTEKELSLESTDLLSFETLTNALANTSGQYLGAVSKYAQYPLSEQPTEKSVIANAWEDVAQLLAEDGSPEALGMLRKYGVETCRVSVQKDIKLQEKLEMRCNGIIPFLVGALRSGQSGAEQYHPTQADAQTGYIATANGSTYISAQQAASQAEKLVQYRQLFSRYAKQLGMTTEAAVARHLFLQSMGDLSAESELRVDEILYQVYQKAASRQQPPAEFQIEPYTRASAAYNAKRMRQDRAQVFRKLSRWADIAFLVWCMWDLSKWTVSGLKLARSVMKASRMARNGATVVERALMLRRLNIAPKLRKVTTFSTRMQAKLAPAVLAQAPQFGVRPFRLAEMPGAAKSVEAAVAGKVRFSAQTGVLTADLKALRAEGLTPKQITDLKASLQAASADANTVLANRGFVPFKNSTYRKELHAGISKQMASRGFDEAAIASVLDQTRALAVTTPPNLHTFKAPELFRMGKVEGVAGASAQVNRTALAGLMTKSFGKAPTMQQLDQTSQMLTTALTNTNVQFANRGWLANRFSTLTFRKERQYKKMFMANLNAEFDKAQLIYKNLNEYNLYKELQSVLGMEASLKAPTVLSAWKQPGVYTRGALSHTAGITAFVPGKGELPQSLPLSVQSHHKKKVKALGEDLYQRITFTVKESGKGPLVEMGIDSNALRAFKLHVNQEEIPLLVRASSRADLPLEFKVSGSMPWHPSQLWHNYRQTHLESHRFFLRGKSDVYVHKVPVFLRQADGNLQSTKVVLKADSHLGLRDIQAVVDGDRLGLYAGGALLQPRNLTFRLPKHQIHPLVDVLRQGQLEAPLHLTLVSGKNKITPLMWATGLSLSSASTSLITPLENVYGEKVTETDKILISLALPYAPSLFAPLFSPLVMKVGALRTLQLALGVSTAGLAFATTAGFYGKLNPDRLPPIWPLWVSGTAIGISSALSRSGLNLLIDSMGGGASLLKSMAYKNIGAVALLLPPFVANFVDKEIDFSLAFPVLGALSAGALTWVCVSRIDPMIGRAPGFMPLKPLKGLSLREVPSALGGNIRSIHKNTWTEVGKTGRLLLTEQVLPLVAAATAFTGFEAASFNKAGNQMVRPKVKDITLPAWFPESNRNNLVAILTSLSVIGFPLATRLAAKPALRALANPLVPGDEYRRMLKISYALNITGSSLLFANGFNGPLSWGMLGLGMVGIGTANMTQSLQKLSNINVLKSKYVLKKMAGMSEVEKAAFSRRVVTQTMTGFPVQQLGLAIVPTLVGWYTDRQIDEGIEQRTNAPRSSLWIPMTSIGLSLALAAPSLGLLPKRLPTGSWWLGKGVLGSYPNAAQQMQQPLYLKDAHYGMAPGFSALSQEPLVEMKALLPSKKTIDNSVKSFKDRLHAQEPANGSASPDKSSAQGPAGSQVVPAGTQGAAVRGANL